MAIAEPRLTLEHVTLRWMGTHWRAYNAGEPTPHCQRHWSTSLGSATAEEALDMFRSSTVTFWPPLMVLEP